MLMEQVLAEYGAVEVLYPLEVVVESEQMRRPFERASRNPHVVHGDRRPGATQRCENLPIPARHPPRDRQNHHEGLGQELGQRDPVLFRAAPEPEPGRRWE
jgi:hypothetical protein